MQNIEQYITVPQAARELGIPTWRCRELVDRVFPTAARLGLYRLVPSDGLARLREELDSVKTPAGVA
jgi:hypothetical protein